MDVPKQTSGLVMKQTFMNQKWFIFPWFCFLFKSKYMVKISHHLKMHWNIYHLLLTEGFQATVGDPKTTKLLCSGHFLVETNSAKQWHQLSNVKTFVNIPILNKTDRVAKLALMDPIISRVPYNDFRPMIFLVYSFFLAVRLGSSNLYKIPYIEMMLSSVDSAWVILKPFIFIII